MSETQTLGPCTECGTPRDACTGPDYCCDECLHFPPDWEGYGPTSVTAPDPAGPTDAQAELREAIAEALHGQYGGPAPTWRTASEALRDQWRSDADDLIAALPAVRAALDAQEAHGPGKCVSVADANRVLAEERARLEAALDAQEAVRRVKEVLARSDQIGWDVAKVSELRAALAGDL